MNSFTHESETGRDLGKVGGFGVAVALGAMFGGPIGAGIGAFIAKKTGAAAGAKIGGHLFGDTKFYCPKCGCDKCY